MPLSTPSPHLNNYFRLHICLSIRPCVCVCVRHTFDFPSPWTAAERGEAELRILDFKTTWSEIQKASLTAAERGEAELRILDFKTTWSEFQKASQTTAEQGEVELCVCN